MNANIICLWSKLWIYDHHWFFCAQCQVDAVTKADFARDLEREILKFEPFSRHDVVKVIGVELKSHNYFTERTVEQHPGDSQYVPGGGRPGLPNADIINEDSDERVIIILAICLSVVSVCGIAVVVHWCRHNRYRVSVSSEKPDGGPESNVVIGMSTNTSDGNCLLHLVRAKCVPKHSNFQNTKTISSSFIDDQNSFECIII